MKYLLALLLNIFYAICYERSISFFIVIPFTIIMLRSIYHYAVKTNSKIGSLLELLIFTLPFAWRSIVGNDFKNVPICWFYIIGLVIFLKLIFSFKITKIYINKVELVCMLCIFFLMFWGIIPLINSYSFSNGLTEFIMYTFFYAITFASILHQGSLTQDNKYTVIKSFVYMTMYCSILIAIQFILNHIGIQFLKTGVYGSYNVRYSYAYMFEDMSSASIILVSGAMMCLTYGRKIIKYPYLAMIIIIVGTALSSTRTGIVAFGVVASIYIITSKSSKHKIAKSLILFVSTCLVFKVYNTVRPMSALSQIVSYDNGRLDLIKKSIMLFKDYPIFGTGFDSSAFMLLTGSEVVGHTYILTILTMTGIIYTFIFIVLIAMCLILAKKKHNIEELWILVLAFVGSCFIPNLMGARFLAILFPIVFLSDSKDKNIIKYHM